MTAVMTEVHAPVSLLAHLDADLLEKVVAGAPWAYRSWEPPGRAVVLGRGNRAETEAREARCARDKIPILRRRGGGGTVLLAPGILVVTLVKQVRHQFHIKEYFQQINDLIMAALRTLAVRGLSQRGHSDICLGERKILGSSMYRKKSVLFYTASLMVCNDLAEIDRYLKHPSKEPDYRQGRSHADFLTTVSREYPDLTLKMVKDAIDDTFRQRLEEIE